jgi:hypothetical protein
VIVLVAQLFVFIAIGSADSLRSKEHRRCDPATRTCGKKHGATPTPTITPTVTPSPEETPSPDATPSAQPSPEVSPSEAATAPTSPSSSPTSTSTSASTAPPAPSSTSSSPDPTSGAGTSGLFSKGSYWNTPLPASAPVDPDSDGIISFLLSDNSTSYIRLGGAGSTGKWANPVYWSGSGDPTYAVVNTCSLRQPPAFSSVRIPVGAAPDPTSDAAMTVYDLDRGAVYAFWHTRYDASQDRWSACGGTVYYLGSNGLHRDLPASDDARNTGHRGVPPTTYAVRFAEIRSGSIDHVLKIAVNTTRCSHVFPMVGDECGTTAAYAPPEGTRIRIRPTVDLSKLGLSPAAAVVARALQRYGAVIGDQSGGPVTLKLENTIAEGRGWLWDGVLTSDSLKTIPLSAFEVVRHGYQA